MARSCDGSSRFDAALEAVMGGLATMAEEGGLVKEMQVGMTCRRGSVTASGIVPPAPIGWLEQRSTRLTAAVSCKSD